MPKKLTPAGQAAPPVEPNIGPAIPKRPPAKRQTARPTPTSDTLYVRNLHQIQARVTLTTGREIQLAPRGQREDLDIITVEEREDPRFIANLGLIFELVEPAVAKEIISKQHINAKSKESPLWQHLRNPQGKEYTNRVAQIEEAFERQGVVVATIEETGSGRFTDSNVAVVPIGPEITQVPGSPGHPATDAMLSVPSTVSPEEYHEFLLWKQYQEMKARGNA